MRALRLLLSSILALATSACATVVSGTTQTIAFNSRPQNASCELARDGSTLKQFTTPAAVVTSKSNHSLNVSCQKAGFAPVAGYVPSDENGWIFGNLFIGGLVGVSIDLLTHADQSYPPVVTLLLHPDTTSPPAPATARLPVADLSRKVGPWLLAE